MFGQFRSVVLGILGLAALAVGPAKADLIISCTGQTGCGILASDSTNTFAFFNGAIGNFNINNLSALGVNGSGGNPLLGNSTYDVINHGNGIQTLTLNITETNLNLGTGLEQFLQNYSSSQVNATVNRQFFLDPTNSGLLAIALGTGFHTTGSNHAVAFNDSQIAALNGLFSVTEIITITINGLGNLNASDQLSALAVPEPMSLSLLGFGLIGLAGASRLRRKTRSDS